MSISAEAVLSQARLPDEDCIEAPFASVPLWHSLRRHPAMMIGGGVLIIMVLLALLAPWLAPHSPYEKNLGARYLPPIWYPAGTWEHILGTDGLGRDYLSRLLYGARISMMIGLLTTLISAVIGIVLGVLGGYYGGKIDVAVNFIVTTRLSMPVTLVAVVVASIMGSSLQIIVIVLGCLIWDRFAVVTRSAVQELRNLEYITAARAIGCSNIRIILSQILPNIAHYLLVVLTIEIAHAILLESALSFLGLGVQPPAASWGLMIAEGQSQMIFKPWLIAIPGCCLFVLIMAISPLGDGLRDMSALKKSTR